MEKNAKVSIAVAGAAATMASLGKAAESAADAAHRLNVALAGIPDRVSIDPQSPHFWPHYKKLGVMIDGKERLGDVHEFCVSERWAKVRVKDGSGQYKTVANGRAYLTEKVEGLIEPFLKTPLKDGSTEADQDALAKAEAKRARRAAKRAKHAV